MKKLIITTMALATIGVAAKAIGRKKNKFSFTITDQSDGVLADITDENIIFHEDVKVYFNDKLVD